MDTYITNSDSDYGHLCDVIYNKCNIQYIIYILIIHIFKQICYDHVIRSKTVMTTSAILYKKRVIR